MIPTYRKPERARRETLEPTPRPPLGTKIRPQSRNQLEAAAGNAAFAAAVPHASLESPASFLALQSAHGNAAVERILRSQEAGQEISGDKLLPPDYTAESGSDPLDAFARAVAGPGGELPYRTRMEAAFGESFAGVHAHLGASEPLGKIGARAAASGDRIAFASTAPSEGEVAHEAAHVVQQKRFGASLQALPLVSRSEDAAELEAEVAADAVSTGARAVMRTPPSARIARQEKKVSPPPAGPYTGYGQFPPSAPPAFNVFEVPSAQTPAGAPAAFDAYLKLSPADQETARSWSYSTGALQKALTALGSSNAQNKYADVVREITRWVEEYETRKLSGKTDEQMAESHGKWMEAQAVAKAKATAGTATPSTKQIAAAGQAIVAGKAIPQGVPPKWDTPGFPQAKWTAAGHRSIDAMVNYATANYPSLGLKKEHFVLAFKEMEVVSGAALAYHTSGPGGASRIGIGYDFVKTVLMTDDLDKMPSTPPKPEYMIEVVVHELLGHQEFEGASHAMGIYDAAAKYRPSYTRPAEGSKERRDEQQSFGYHATELYAIMRGFDYRHTVAPAGKVPGVFVLQKPEDEIARYVDLMAKEWEPSVGAALVRGLYARFRIDPRLSGAAVGALAKAIKDKFPSKAADILK